MSFYAIPPIISAVLFIAAGLFVYLKNPNGRNNKLFLLLCLVTFTWQFSWFFLFQVDDPNEGLPLIKIGYTGIIFIPIIFYHFFISFLGLPKERRLIPVAYFSGFLFLLTLYTSESLISGSYKYVFGFYPKAGMFHPVYLGFLGLIFARLVYLLFLSMRESYQQVGKYKQIRLLFAALIFYALAAFDFLVNYGIEIYPVGFFFILISLCIVGYSIVRYHLMDITTVIHKTIMWAVMSSLVVVPVVGLFYAAHTWIQDLSPGQMSLLVGTVALLLIPYVKLIQPYIDHLFQRRKHDLQKILQDFIHEIAVLKGLDELVKKLQQTISSVLYPERVSIILFDVKSAGFEPLRAIGLPGVFAVERHVEFLKGLERINTLAEADLIEADPRYAEIKEGARPYFDEANAKLAVPLMHDGRLQGVINLGQKKNLKPYTTLELDFLASLKVEASIAFSNSLLYDDVSKMSEELKQWAAELEHKVQERTRELAESKKELEQSYQKLKELDHLKSQFFANISHELRTPLTLILAPLESLLKAGQEDKGGERQHHYRIMYSNGLRLLKLINNLLDLAKIDAGKMELYYSKGDLRTFIKGIVTSVSPMAEKKQILLSYKDQGEFPEFYFDRDKVEKVMLNLIFNSLKFTDKGGRVEVSCRRENGSVWISVSDTGIGIAEENHAKIFERFSQVDASDSRKYEGSGVGLALAKELVELHRGRIWVDSAIGKGTTMTFTLPLITEQNHLPADRRINRQEVEEKKRAEDWTHALHTEAEYSGAGIIREIPETYLPKTAEPSGQRLLIVEDNPDMLNFLIFQLQEGYILLTARDGQEGVEQAKAQVPDLVISDVMMPLKDGYQLCREIKSDPKTRHIPVILLTAKADLSMKIEGLQYGADDYLTKPFSSEELKARIKSLLNLRQLERELQSRNEELQQTLEELKETQAQLVHTEKMAALGLLVAGVAHEMNNPVSFAKASLSTLRRALGQAREMLQESQASQAVRSKVEEMDRAMGIIHTGLERTEAIVNELKNFVRKDQLYFRLTDLHQGLDSTLTLLSHELDHSVKVEKEYGPLEPVETIPGQMNQVFMNLLHNAIEAIRVKGTNGIIRIKTWKTEQEAFISIWDNGTGIREEDRTRVFEPFFTTKEVGRGTGLGLAVTYRILQNHGGRIMVDSDPGQWTRFTIAIPFRNTTKLERRTGC